jgi:putative addiction module killer protein
MVTEIYKIKFYTDEKGKEPFNEWLCTLEKTEQARIDVRLTRVKNGNLGDCSSVGDGVFELRFKNHSGFRVYFGYDGDTIIIILNGGDKDTQNRDIEKAKNYWKDYNKKKAGV